MDINKLTGRVVEYLGGIQAEGPSPEEAELLETALSAIDFIYAMGKIYAFEDYLKGVKEGKPPLVLASFETREEADAWLANHPESPHGAVVSVRGKLYTVSAFREPDHRALLALSEEELRLLEKQKDER